MASGRLMALLACRRQLAVSSALRHAVLQGTFNIPNGCDLKTSSHMRGCSIIFVECLFGRCLEMVVSQCTCPLRITHRGFCVVREHLSKEWSCKMTRFAALPTEMQCDGRAIILAERTVIMSYSSS